MGGLLGRGSIPRAHGQVRARSRPRARDAGHHHAACPRRHASPQVPSRGGKPRARWYRGRTRMDRPDATAELLQQAFAAMAAGLLVVSRDGTVLLANPGAASVCGREDLVGRAMTE